VDGDNQRGKVGIEPRKGVPNNKSAKVTPKSGYISEDYQIKEAQRMGSTAIGTIVEQVDLECFW
jgi:hypothetical protein